MAEQYKKNELESFCSLATETENIRGTRYQREWYRSDLRELFSGFSQEELNIEVHAIPELLTAGRREKLELRFDNIGEYVKEEGHLLVYFPCFWGGIRQERDPSVFIVDGAPKTYNGYISANISVSCSNPDVELALTVTSQGSVCTAADIVLVSGVLLNHDHITLCIGDDVGQLPRTYEYSGDYRFCIAVDQWGKNKYIKAANYPVVTVKANKEQKYSVNAPAYYQEEGFYVRVAAVDDYMNKSSDYSSSADVYLVNEAGENQLIQRITIRNGYAEIQNIHISKFGIYKISVIDIESGLSGISNPFVYKENTARKIVFGEIHCHTELSDGLVSADEAYRFGKENVGLDFAAISDHMDIKSLMYDQKDRWRISVDTTNEFNAPGSYATLIGQEWTGLPHINVYFRGDTGTDLSSRDPNYGTPEKLWSFLKDKEALTIIHHPKYLGKAHKWNSYDEKLMRLVEIYSGWGSSEYGHESAVAQGLDKGLIFGFTGGTDNHIGKVGLGDLTNDGNGITAVFVDELTRENVFDEMYKRHCYATTGAKILLKFSIGDSIMGDIVTIKKSDTRLFDIEVIGTSDIDSIMVIKNGIGLAVSAQSNFYYTGILEEQYETDQDYYYLKVTQKDGHMAWSSPIWIKSK